MSRRPWYKRYGADFISGTLSMSLEEKGAYSIVLDLLYDRGEPIPDDPRYIARVCGCSTRKWNTIRERLLEMGKIYLTADGRISNRRADRQMPAEDEEAEKLSENGAKSRRKIAEREPNGEDKTAENRHDASENKHLAEKGLGDGLKPNQKPEARKKEDTEANASSANESRSPPPVHPDDLKSRIFGPALDWLANQSGKPIAKLRPLVGRWCRDHGDGAVIHAFEQAARAGPVDPVSWITGLLNKGTTNGKRPDAAQRIARDAEDIDRYFGVGSVPPAADDDQPGFDLEGDFRRVQ